MYLISTRQRIIRLVIAPYGTGFIQANSEQQLHSPGPDVVSEDPARILNPDVVYTSPGDFRR